MTELSFLLELLLNHKLAKTTKEAVIERIKAIEAQSFSRPAVVTSGYAVQSSVRPPKTAQSPSTQRILDQMAAEGSVVPEAVPAHQVDPVSIPSQIAQTPAAAAALAARNEAIRIAVSGKEEKGRTSPRKF